MSLSLYSTTVVCTFIPSLPDELTISIGETLRVLAGYLDGWSLFKNCRGKQGMVTNECLEKSFSSMRLLPPNGGYRTRVSVWRKPSDLAGNLFLIEKPSSTFDNCKEVPMLLPHCKTLLVHMWISLVQKLTRSEESAKKRWRKKSTRKEKRLFGMDTPPAKQTHSTNFLRTSISTKKWLLFIVQKVLASTFSFFLFNTVSVIDPTAKQAGNQCY
jgi:hypothetical protein